MLQSLRFLEPYALSLVAFADRFDAADKEVDFDTAVEKVKGKEE
jgi:hypothetical protein